MVWYKQSFFIRILYIAGNNSILDKVDFFYHVFLDFSIYISAIRSLMLKILRYHQIRLSKRAFRAASPFLDAYTPGFESEDHETSGPAEDPGWHKTTLWFDNLVPIKLRIDPRSYFIKRYSTKFIDGQEWMTLVPAKLPDGSELFFLNAEANFKEGGMFMEFKYKGGTTDELFQCIQHHLAQKSLRSPFNWGKINVYQVKGRPWVEDLVSRVPSSRLHVEFYGPDLTKESLYREFRIFGKIVDIKLQPSSLKDTPRFASVEFLRKRSATSARNCIHGEKFSGTRLEIDYERNETHLKVWNWVSANNRISIAILLGILALFTYLVFDPWRIFSVTNRITSRYSIDTYTSKIHELTNWLYIMTFGDLRKGKLVDLNRNAWHEREVQEKRLEALIHETPESAILISGPKGSGKSDLVRQALSDHQYFLN